MAQVLHKQTLSDAESDDGIRSAGGEDEQNSGDERQADNLIGGGNEGWANVFSKVLHQNPKVKKRKKTVVLAKALKDADREHKKAARELSAEKRSKKKPKKEPLKIVDNEGNVVDQEEVSSSAESSDDDGEGPLATTKDAHDKLRLRRQRMELGLVVPQPGDPYEKNLLRTATKGVVQLFNAVNKFQDEKRAKRAAEDSSDEEDRRYKKGRFMETLNKIQEKKQSSTSKWEALRDDFMMGSKMKDWDKQQNDSDGSA